MKMRIGLTALASGAVLAIGAGLAPAQAQVQTQRLDGYFYVWEHTDYRGRQHRWWGDDIDYRYNGSAGNWNDRVSSVSNRGRGRENDVRLFVHTHYRGSSICVPNGASWESMPPGWNDRVSSHRWVTTC